MRIELPIPDRDIITIEIPEPGWSPISLKEILSKFLREDIEKARQTAPPSPKPRDYSCGSRGCAGFPGRDDLAFEIWKRDHNYTGIRVETPTGIIFHYDDKELNFKDGRLIEEPVPPFLHNGQGPALIIPGVAQLWYRRGLLNRDLDPAIEWADGGRERYLDGKRDDDDRIACVCGDNRLHFREDILHNDFGPAIELEHGGKLWFLEGSLISLNNEAYDMLSEYISAMLFLPIIRVGRYDWRTKKMPHIEGFTNVLVHVDHPLSPYVLHDRGRIVENVYHFSHIFRHIEAQDQNLHRFTEEKGWCYPEQTHMIPYNRTFLIDPSYFVWRRMGFHSPFAVRYPAGYRDRAKVVMSLWPRSNNLDDIETDDLTKMDALDYVDARKRIYAPVYLRCARKDPEFARLRERMARGEQLQIVEVDGPEYADDFPYNLAIDNSLVMTEEVVKALVTNTTHPLGHGFVLAVGLMGKENWLI